jgi:hypothetical protein
MKQLTLATVVFAVVGFSNSAFAETQTRLHCTIDDYSPLGRTNVETLRSWMPESIRVEIAENKQVQVFLRPNAIAQGEVRRTSANKLVMSAVREVKDNVGRKTFMTYTLEWFKSNGRIFIEVEPQGYAVLGTAKGTCRTLSSQATPERSFGRAPVARVCDMAIENGTWRRQKSWQKWVAEAQARGLSVQDCEKGSNSS